MIIVNTWERTNKQANEFKFVPTQNDNRMTLCYIAQLPLLDAYKTYQIKKKIIIKHVILAFSLPNLTYQEKFNDDLLLRI